MIGDAALPMDRVWTLKVQKVLSKMFFKSSKCVLFSILVWNFIPMFDSIKVKISLSNLDKQL